MSKFRIIPIILTDGINVLKGEKFNPWRPVGILEPLLNIYENRDVDELILIDVDANSRLECISTEIVSRACKTLSIPLSVGGGLNSLDRIRNVLKAGADKVIIGSSSITDPHLIQDARDEFGSQSIICSLDINSTDLNQIFINGGRNRIEVNAVKAAIDLENSGAGEIFIQLIDLEGTLNGVDLSIASKIIKEVSVPVSIAGGINSNNDFYKIYETGFSGAGVGAFFQFTENTPSTVRGHLISRNVQTRNLFKS
jgi:cyclase